MRLLCFLGCAFLWAASAAHATAPSPEARERQRARKCVHAMMEMQAALGVSDLEIELTWNHQSKATLKLVRWRKGAFGGRILTFETIGTQWGSEIDSMGFDPQGDPRWLLFLFGEEAAAHLGARQIDKRTLELPDAVELIARLNVLDANLRRTGRKPLAFRFYEQRVAGYTIYNRRLGQERLLALAHPRFIARRDGSVRHPRTRGVTHFLHDLAYHSGVIFTPTPLADYFASAIQLWVAAIDSVLAQGFDHYAKAGDDYWRQLGQQIFLHGGQIPRDSEHTREVGYREARRAFFADLKLEITNRIDNTTAEIGPGVVRWAQDLEKNPRQHSLLHFQRAAYDLLFDGEAVAEHILRRSAPLGGPSYRSDSLYRWHHVSVPLNDFVDVGKVRADLKRFLEENRNLRRGFDPWKPVAGLEGRATRFCLQFRTRRAEIVEAALQIEPSLNKISNLTASPTH